MPSKHFKLQKISEGVYAAIHQPGGWAIANAGWIDLGESLLVFDTFLSISAAKDLRQAARELTGKPIRSVINSHFHNDHIRGNPVFDDAKIYASVGAHELILTKGMQELKWDREHAAEHYQKSSQQAAEAKSDTDRKRHEFMADLYGASADGLFSQEARLPDQSFEDSMHFEGPLRRAELAHYGGGHSGDDSVLLLEEGIAFVADLLFVGCHPYLAHGNPQELLQTLEKLGEMDLEVVVPGHGAVGTAADLRLMADYIGECERLAEAYVGREEEIESLTADRLPEAFRHWEFEIFFKGNIEFLNKRKAG